MSSTIHFSLVSNPQLLDVVDEEWMQDKLEDDGELIIPCLKIHPLWCCTAMWDCTVQKRLPSELTFLGMQTCPCPKACRDLRETWTKWQRSRLGGNNLRSGETLDCTQSTDSR